MKNQGIQQDLCMAKSFIQVEGIDYNDISHPWKNVIPQRYLWWLQISTILIETNKHDYMFLNKYLKEKTYMK